MLGAIENWVALLILAWMGLLVLAFGIKSYVRRTWPSTALWTPRDRDRANRVGTAILIPIATLVVILYGAPMWVFDQISGGRFDTSWAIYTPDFQRLRLPWVIGCLAGLLALQSFVALRGRWSRLTRRINIALNLAIAVLILSFAVTGNLFQSSTVDQIARSVLALVAVIYVPSVGAQILQRDRPNQPGGAHGSALVMSFPFPRYGRPGRIVQFLGGQDKIFSRGVNVRPAFPGKGMWTPA
jgi:hypothetical protein